jgi:hypothetical protein
MKIIFFISLEKKKKNLNVNIFMHENHILRFLSKKELRVTLCFTISPFFFKKKKNPGL